MTEARGESHVSDLAKLDLTDPALYRARLPARALHAHAARSARCGGRRRPKAMRVPTRASGCSRSTTTSRRRTATPSCSAPSTVRRWPTGRRCTARCSSAWTVASTRGCAGSSAPDSRRAWSASRGADAALGGDDRRRGAGARHLQLRRGRRLPAADARDWRHHRHPGGGSPVAVQAHERLRGGPAMRTRACRRSSSWRSKARCSSTRARSARRSARDRRTTCGRSSRRSRSTPTTAVAPASARSSSISSSSCSRSPEARPPATPSRPASWRSSTIRTSSRRCATRRPYPTPRSTRSSAGRRRCPTSRAAPPATRRFAACASPPASASRSGTRRPIATTPSSTIRFASTSRRTPNDHVSFGGGGHHYCLGANLARREIAILFEELLRRTHRIEVVAPPVYSALGIFSPILVAPKELPVRLT